MMDLVIEEIKTQFQGEKGHNKLSEIPFSRLLEPVGGMRGSLDCKINCQVGSLFKPPSPLQSLRVLDVLTFSAQTYKLFLPDSEQTASTVSNLPLFGLDTSVDKNYPQPQVSSFITSHCVLSPPLVVTNVSRGASLVNSSCLIKSSIEIERALLSDLNGFHFQQSISLTGKLLFFDLLTHNGVFNSNRQLVSAGRNVSKMESPRSSMVMSLPAAEKYFSILLLPNQFEEDILIRSVSAHIFGSIQLMFFSIKDSLLVPRGLFIALNRWAHKPGI